MSGKIATTAQLREFLANMMVGVKDGDVKVDEASRIVKLAEKINESFYAELKVAQVHESLGRQVDEIGKLKIGSE